MATVVVVGERGNDMVDIDRLTQHSDFLTAFYQVALWEPSDGKEVALKALAMPAPYKLSAWDEEFNLVGVCSYRMTDEYEEFPIKRINMGVRYPGQGIGKAFVRDIAKRTNCAGQWTKSVESAWGWCEALGMKWNGEITYDIRSLKKDSGRRIYQWDGEDVRKFYDKQD